MALSEDQKKALDLTVDSLKLYITLATFAIAGLLGIYTSQKNTGNISLFYGSVTLLFLCAIISTILINSFINPTNSSNAIIHNTGARIFNGLAIVLFLGGVAIGGLYVVKNTKKTTDEKKGKMTILDGKIEIENSLDASLRVEMDSSKGIKTIFLSPEK